MRKNRKRSKKMSVIAINTMRIGAIVLVAFVMVILNILSNSSCTQLLKVMGQKERELAKLEESRQRESTRWEEMRTPDKIESALLRHGLAMKLPRADQSIRMRNDGTPYPGQLAVRRAMQSVAAPQAAQYRRSQSSNSIRWNRRKVR